MNIVNIIYPRRFLNPCFIGDVIGAIGNIISSERQMDFQEEMSNTAHQRQVKDLYKAGLNPILSAKYGGASTPLGAGFQMPVIGGSEHQIAAASSARAQAENLDKQGNVLDTEVERARILNNIYKQFPEVAIAHALAGSSTADKVAATVLNRGGKMVEEMVNNEGANSAKSIDKGKDYWFDQKGKLNINISPKGTISREENDEIDKEYLRQQHELKRRQYRSGY